MSHDHRIQATLEWEVGLEYVPDVGAWATLLPVPAGASI
jgi:hypothetical protein